MIAPGASSINQSGDIAGIAPLVLVDEQEVGPAPPHLTLAFIALTMLAKLGEAFCQRRTALRAWRLAVGQALTLGTRTISRIISLASFPRPRTRFRGRTEPHGGR